MGNVKVHSSATVEDNAKLGEGTSIWHYAHVREGARLGKNCSVGHCAYVGMNVTLGDNVKIGNKASVFQGVTIEDDVLIGPHVVFTNDLRPRSIGEWKVEKTIVKKGASIGSNSTILCGLTIGTHAMVGAGSVVTRDVPSHMLVYGSPAKPRGFVCFCGESLKETGKDNDTVICNCVKCRKEVRIAKATFMLAREEV